MKIIFQGLEPAVRGNSNGMELQGKKDYDGAAYTKFFWHEAKDGSPTPLGKIAKSLQPGQLVELTYDDSKFKNLKGIEVLDGSSSDSKSTGPKSSGGGRGRSSGKSNFRDPDHTDRSSAMYLAWDIVSKMAGITEGKAVTAKAQPSIMAQFEDLSKKLEGYLHNGEFVCVREPGSDDEPAGDAQPASQNDDDDIPF